MLGCCRLACMAPGSPIKHEPETLAHGPSALSAVQTETGCALMKIAAGCSTRRAQHACGQAVQACERARQHHNYARPLSPSAPHGGRGPARVRGWWTRATGAEEARERGVGSSLPSRLNSRRAPMPPFHPLTALARAHASARQCHTVGMPRVECRIVTDGWARRRHTRTPRNCTAPVRRHTYELRLIRLALGDEANVSVIQRSGDLVVHIPHTTRGPQLPN